MPPAITMAVPLSPIATSLRIDMSLLEDVVSRFAKGVSGFIGDEVLMHAAVSAAAQVMASDDHIDRMEVEIALVDLQADPALSKGYFETTIEDELQAGIERTQTSSGRRDNLNYVKAISERPIDQRNSVFLLALDVAAAHKGISQVETAVVDAIAEILNIDKASLAEIAKARAFVSGSVALE